MRQTTYFLVRQLPSALGWGLPFVFGFWAAVDQPSLVRWYRYKMDNFDVSATGAIVVVAILAYSLTLWFTRSWNVTDREFYRQQLKVFYAKLAGLHGAAATAATDGEIIAMESPIMANFESCFDWIDQNMGTAAAEKFCMQGVSAMVYQWPGHSSDVTMLRSDLLNTLKTKLGAIEDLMAKDDWDHPESLSKRRSAQQWKARRTWIVKRLRTLMPASTRS